MDGDSIMFSWDEIFGTRNKDGSWDLEITGTNSDFNGDSCEGTLTIKGANVEMEMSICEAPNVRVMATGSAHVESRTKHFPLT